MPKGPDLHHAQQSLAHAIAMSMLTFVESVKETNIIETKQHKSKSNRKSKAAEYTIFEDKFQMPEYTTFKKSELLVSYSNFPFVKMDFLAKPIVLTAIQSISFPSIYIATDVA